MRYYVSRPESIIDKFLSDFSQPTNVGKHMDVYKQDNQFVVEIDMPGFNKENIKIDFKEDVLSISANQEETKDESEKEMIYKSRRIRNIKRQIRFSEVDVDAISAEYTNGTLKVVLPCATKVEPELKQITLQ